MSLKFRYASVLLAVFAVLCAAVWFALLLLNEEQYLLLGVLGIVLYFGMFFCGRKMAKVFYLLSILKFLKKEGGSATAEACRNFLRTTLPKKSAEDIGMLFAEVLNKLEENEQVIVTGDRVTLLSP